MITVGALTTVSVFKLVNAGMDRDIKKVGIGALWALGTAFAWQLTKIGFTHHIVDRKKDFLMGVAAALSGMSVIDGIKHRDRRILILGLLPALIGYGIFYKGRLDLEENHLLTAVRRIFLFNAYV